jgi:hypothetical protein
MRRGWRITAAIVMIASGLIGLIAGASLLATFGLDGRYDVSSRLVTDTHGFALDTVAVGDVPVEAVIEIEATSPDPVFIGIAPLGDVAAWLDAVEHERITRLGPERFDTEDVPGDRAPSPPETVAWEATSNDGALIWPVRPGSWAVAIVRADAATGLDLQVEASLAVPAATPAGIAIAVAGALVTIGGAVLIIRTGRAR